jgi:hypothetical protein
MPQVTGEDDGKAGFGVKGGSQSSKGFGVVGITSRSLTIAGFEETTLPNVTAGIVGFSHDIPGLNSVGVVGHSDTGRGVWGISPNSMATVGDSETGVGVYGASRSGAGVVGVTQDSSGVYGESQHSEGVHGISHSQAAGVAGYNDNPQGGTGTWGESQHGPAGVFKGDVIVTGDVKLTGGDLAENFKVDNLVDAEPGTVMVLDGVDQVRVSDSPYDRRVVGVVAGAGDYHPAVLLSYSEEVAGHRPLALVGKVFCKVDASFAPISVGDLLTTSPTSGHAMRATDSRKAFGAVLGKAMAAIDRGTGLLPIVIMLH